MSIKTISIQNFRQCYNSTLFMIDVRNPAEYAHHHLQGARLYPLPTLNPQQVEQDLQQQGLTTKDPVFILCQAGMRAQMAAQQLAASTGLHVVVVEGGTNACVQSGLPLIQG